MAFIARQSRTLADGTTRTYGYLRQGHEGQSIRSLGTLPENVLRHCYRASERARTRASLQAGSSLLIVGETGSGKSTLATFVAEDLRALGFTVVQVRPYTVKATLEKIANQLGLELIDLEGKRLTIEGLQQAIKDHLLDHTAVLILDSAHRAPVALRTWFEDLLDQGQPLLLLATNPPARDIFFKLPRLELAPLEEPQIRDLMEASSQELNLDLTPADLARLQERAAGNPLLARRVVTEEHLGLEAAGPDHTEWFDGTPLVLALLSLVVIIRLVGLGLNDTNLYLLGGILTTVFMAARILLFRIPPRSQRLGQ